MALTKVSRGLLSTGIVDNSDATAITIDSSEKIGITGQTSPNFNLDGGFVTQTWGWHLNTSYQAGFTYTTTDRSLSIFTKSADNADSIKFSTGGSATERARITAAGILQLAGGGNDNVGEINFGNTAQDANRLQIRHQSSTWIIKTVDSEPLLFGTTNSERARILANGTLLVGKTADDNSVGFKTNTSSTYMVASGGTPTFINRLSDNGDLLEFRKDSSTKGRIGTDGSDIFIGSDDTNLLFFQNGFLPANSVGGTRDNASDLGAASARFKDLYLSGGVFLGGTGSANQMEDYEEGAWTPTLQSFDGTFAVQSASYRKIGQTCFAFFHLDISTSHSGTNANIVVTGLPFSTQNFGSVYGMATSMHCNLWATVNKPDNGIMGPGSNVVSFYKNTGQTGIYAPSLSDIGTGNFLCCIVFPTA